MRPESPALVQGGQVCTYGALWQEVRRVGSALQSRIAPGDRMALVMDNSADLAVAIYAVWWAGGVVVALNPTLHAVDVDRLVGISEAQEVWRTLPPGAGTDSPCREVLDHDLAALAFTSGTTGEPKGVMLSHGQLAANVQAIQHALPMSPDDVTLCVLPFHYAFGGSVLHTHLTLGAALVLENSLMYPQRIVQRMAEVGATHFYGVPSSFYLLLERGRLADIPLPRLRHVAQAGGAMDAERLDQLQRALPGVGFWTMYGQTEACARLTTLSPADLTTRRGSVGQALPGISLRIRHADGGDLPVGSTGEVWARGPNVMLGYWRSPQDTAQVLQDGWLHTGDIGHLDEDGFLYLHGRSRDILKVGAHRVSPQEIEHLIQAVPGVRECAVVPLPDPVLGEVVRACVVPSADHAGWPSLVKDIQRACQERLALYKRPKRIDFFDDLPRTASGKVRKHLIPAPEPTSMTSVQGKAPASP